MFAGPPCSGKSSLAQRLAARIGTPHLSVDDVRSTLMPDSDNRAEHRRIAYRALHFAARHLLQCGHSVIVDATYNPPEQRQALETIAREIGVSVFLVECSDSARWRLLGSRSAGAIPRSI